MGTRRYSVQPGGTYESVVEAVGAATVTAFIELTIDTANTDVNWTGGGTRAISRDEVITALKVFEEYLIKNIWPPS
jgi:hypothetical protein